MNSFVRKEKGIEFSISKNKICKSYGFTDGFKKKNKWGRGVASLYHNLNFTYGFIDNY